jgi:hypothetical protein
MARSLYDNNIVTQNAPNDSNGTATIFAPVLMGPPPEKVFRKRPSKRSAGTAKLDAEQPARHIVMRDPRNVKYWEAYDEETNGQVIGRFCHELHENVVNTLCSNFECSTTGTDPEIQRMEAEALNWYLEQPNAVQTGAPLHHIYDSYTV